MLFFIQCWRVSVRVLTRKCRPLLLLRLLLPFLLYRATISRKTNPPTTASAIGADMVWPPGRSVATVEWVRNLHAARTRVHGWPRERRARCENGRAAVPKMTRPNRNPVPKTEILLCEKSENLRSQTPPCGRCCNSVYWALRIINQFGLYRGGHRADISRSGLYRVGSI